MECATFKSVCYTWLINSISYFASFLQNSAFYYIHPSQNFIFIKGGFLCNLSLVSNQIILHTWFSGTLLLYIMTVKIEGFTEKEGKNGTHN